MVEICPSGQDASRFVISSLFRDSHHNSMGKRDWESVRAVTLYAMLSALAGSTLTLEPSGTEQLTLYMHFPGERSQGRREAVLWSSLSQLSYRFHRVYWPGTQSMLQLLHVQAGTGRRRERFKITETLQRDKEWFLWRSGKCLNSTVSYRIGCKFDDPFDTQFKDDNEIINHLKRRLWINWLLHVYNSVLLSLARRCSNKVLK